ncbi:MAG: substrate-binding periplasmic protein [Thermodesulfobacteriota bacterium]
MKPFCIIKTALLFTTLFIAAWVLNPALSEAREKQEITISLGGGWAPYLITDPSKSGFPGTGEGILMDIFKKISEKLGYTVKTASYPEKRDIAMLENGLIDFRFDGLEWVDNPDRYFWSDPILRVDDVLVSRKASPIRFNNLDELRNITVITHLGYTYPTLDPYFSSGRLTRSDTPSHCYMLKMLKGKRGDAAVMNKLVALWTLKRHRSLSGSDFTFSKPIDSSGLALMYTDTKWHGFIKDFNRELSRLKADGRATEILNHYK